MSGPNWGCKTRRVSHSSIVCTAHARAVNPHLHRAGVVGAQHPRPVPYVARDHLWGRMLELIALPQRHHRHCGRDRRDKKRLRRGARAVVRHLEQSRLQPRSPSEDRRIGLLLYVAGKEHPHGSVLQAKGYRAVIEAKRGAAVCIDKVRSRMQDQPRDPAQSRQAVARRDPVVAHAPLGNECL